MAYFFGRQFDKSVKYAKQVTTPFPTDYAYPAVASAMTGDMAGAKVDARRWFAWIPIGGREYLSDGGGYPDDAAMLFIEAPGKLGSPAFVPMGQPRQCRTLFISRRATRRGFTKPLANTEPAHQSSRLTFANVRLWHQKRTSVLSSWMSASDPKPTSDACPTLKINDNLPTCFPSRMLLFASDGTFSSSGT